jgi:hypothetical protein
MANLGLRLLIAFFCFLISLFSAICLIVLLGSSSMCAPWTREPHHCSYPPSPSPGHGGCCSISHSYSSYCLL